MIIFYHLVFCVDSSIGECGRCGARAEFALILSSSVCVDASIGEGGRGGAQAEFA